MMISTQIRKQIEVFTRVNKINTKVYSWNVFVEDKLSQRLEFSFRELGDCLVFVLTTAINKSINFNKVMKINTNSVTQLIKKCIKEESTTIEINKDNSAYLAITVNKKTAQKTINQPDKGISNQGTGAPILHNGMRYRSKTETFISNALDSEGCLFYPNARCRVQKENKESDFLICYKGNWGILEVDGEIWHTSAAKDHARDDMFNAHGFWFIRRYPSKRCYDKPNEVVREFLQRMEQFYSQR